MHYSIHLYDLAESKTFLLHIATLCWIIITEFRRNTNAHDGKILSTFEVFPERCVTFSYFAAFLYIPRFHMNTNAFMLIFRVLEYRMTFFNIQTLTPFESKNMKWVKHTPRQIFTYSRSLQEWNATSNSIPRIYAHLSNWLM